MQQEGELQFINRPPFDCDCPVCFTSFKELDEVCQTTCCGNHFCLQCTKQLKSSKQLKCPTCRSDKFDAIQDKFFLRLYLSLEVRCYYSNTGCKWTGELRQLDEHVEKNCLRGLVKCPFCEELCTDVDKHLSTCDKATIACPNRCPGPKQKQSQIKAHLENKCPFRVIIPFKGALPVAANGIVRVAPVSFTMTDYLEHLESGKLWYSPPFYTHERGYKLNIRISTKEVDGYLSLYACILKGEYDHQLQWPLHAEVEISLLNWKDNSSNITKSFYLHGDEYCQRVMVGIIATRFKGITKFASNEELQCSSRAQFLFHNCLSFRIVRINILPLILPEIPPWAGINSTASFTLHSFERNKKEKIGEFFGPFLYTHENGYKVELALKILPIEKDGTTICVLAKALKPDRSNTTLVWPFNGELGIELINWKEDNNHKRFKVIFDDINQSRAILTFREHSQLTCDFTANTEYLRNDCLLFKVVFAVAYSTPCRNSIPHWSLQQGARSRSVLEFTLNKYTTRKLYQNLYYSKPFLASGYKMQISVKANVNGYIGVYVHLMKGPNDDELMWPFCGDVVVELVNWIEDKDHHRQVIELSSFRRVIADHKLNGLGKHQFIDAISNNFLHDDCLYFRVREITVHSTKLSLKRPMWQNSQPLSLFIEFTMTNVSKRKEHGTKFFSPPFFTCIGGYMLCLEAQKSLDQQHIGIYARVLRGQSSCNPVQASIVVELINWRENASHHLHTISINEHSSVNQSNITSARWGTDKFIPYSILSYNSNTNTEYLQDDCVRFRVTLCSTFKKPTWQREGADSFTIAHFSVRIHLGDVYWSPPFYTSARGYRMYLKIHPAGFGTGKGTHVSVLSHLIKGDYDDELNWPFTADVVVDILNWRGDYNHHRVVIPFNEDGSSNSRAKVSELSKVGLYGYGIFKAIEVSTVLSSSSDPQYLLEDCVRIRIHDVAVYSNQFMSKTPSWWQKPLAWQPEFTITGVSQHMKYNTPYISTPFYTHENGYKLRLEVYPNGLNKGAGTHVSVFIRLLKGENDSSLVWPMAINVHVTMINWHKDELHIWKNFTVSKIPIDDCMPVTEKSKFSRGCNQFCLHSILFANSEGVQYVQDDCMRLRIKSIILSHS